MCHVALVPDPVDDLERLRDVEPHRVRLARLVLEHPQELVHARERRPEGRDVVVADVLKDTERCLVEEFIRKSLRDASRDEAVADGDHVHGDSQRLSRLFSPNRRIYLTMARLERVVREW